MLNKVNVSCWFGGLVVIAILTVGGFSGPSADSPDLRVQVDYSKVVHEMRGGIGASWHAMSRDLPSDPRHYDYPVRLNNPRGSAYGGNPPVSDRTAWEELERHASWLGLSWMRVEISQRMYEPEKNTFDWDNEEMQALYRILSWCERSGADVFLQQLWGHVEWNAYPGVHPLLSAPRSLDDFADGLARLLEHLILVKHYKCIKWACITNEPPGGTWGYWWSTGSHPSISITPALQAVRKALDGKGIRVPLSAPDWTDLPRLDPQKIDFDPFVGAYDVHSYRGLDDAGQQILGDWARWAHSHDKPFFLTEIGDMNLGWGGDNPGPKSFDAALSNAEKIIRGLRVGVDAFNRWSFTNRGDLDGQWQLVVTWDRQLKKHLRQVRPEPEAYYGYAIMTRFLPNYSSLLDDSIIADRPESSRKFLTATMRTPKGEITTYLLNADTSERSVEVSYAGLKKAVELCAYRVSEAEVKSTEFRLEPGLVHPVGSGQPVRVKLPARSITVLSTYRLAHDSLGIIRE